MNHPALEPASSSECVEEPCAFLDRERCAFFLAHSADPAPGGPSSS